jgi:putative DNA primase/helicase
MIPTTLEVAGRALSFISPDQRDTWIRMGMALKAEFGDAARDTWLNWGAASDDFNQGSASTSWKSFKDGGKVGIGSLFAEAKNAGFVFAQADRDVPPEKLAADKIAREERAAKAEADRIARAAAAANRAQSQWRTASVDGTSPYLERKQVYAESCRFLADGGLIVPMMRYDFDKPVMVGKQAIAADGSKKYSGGMDKHGAACRLGAVPVDGDLLLMGEGYATGLSVRMAVGHQHPFFVAFDTSGLLPVAQILRAKYPNSVILFCADDDYLTGGTGLAKAMAARDAVGLAAVLSPVFAAPRRAAKNDESLPLLTDFNDLHVAESLDVVRQQITAALDLPVGSPAPSDLGALPPDFIDDSSNFPAPLPDVDPEPVGLSIPSPEALIAHFALIYPTTDIWDGLKRQRLKKSAFEAWVGKDVAIAWAKDGRRRTILRESLPALVGGRAVEGGAGGGKLGEMLDNITLLRGTETVWDAIGQQVMTLGAVRADYTADMTSKWQEHSLRKTVEAKNLVFDPTQQVDPVTHVNMFLGWPLSPKKDMALVGPILALLDSLCSGEDNHDECVLWILKWLAFPLQHPGAKMQTALLMFGEKQGTGKSLLFQDVIAPIYGDYGTVASQHQLDSTFTAWRSRKLFVLFEEVLSRDDKYSHNGTLKYMVTGTSMSVNQKNLPERTERNHLNAVFLSNEPQPIPIELEDRRFFVIEARNKPPESFYNAVIDSINQGGVQAFYQFLLDLPLDGFNEHTKPMMTLAKERVIEFGLNGWMSFHRAWKDGYLSAPYCSCLTQDLYSIYKRWCDRTSERPLTECKFNGFIGGRENKVKRPVSVGPKGKTSRMVYLIEADDETRSLDQQIASFREIADVRADL